jgi:hypothetical protein
MKIHDLLVADFAIVVTATALQALIYLVLIATV